MPVSQRRECPSTPGIRRQRSLSRRRTVRSWTCPTAPRSLAPGQSRGRRSIERPPLGPTNPIRWLEGRWPNSLRLRRKSRRLGRRNSRRSRGSPMSRACRRMSRAQNWQILPRPRPLSLRGFTRRCRSRPRAPSARASAAEPRPPGSGSSSHYAGSDVASAVLAHRLAG
jgi:hypothetical protein